jgi:hypothetical protein
MKSAPAAVSSQPKTLRPFQKSMPMPMSMGSRVRPNAFVPLNVQ